MGRAVGGDADLDSRTRRAKTGRIAAPLFVLMAFLAVLEADFRSFRDVQWQSAWFSAPQDTLKEIDMPSFGRTGVVVVAAIGAGLCMEAPAHGQELVVNGGFEQSNYGNSCCPICGSAISIPGWQAFRVDQLRAPQAPAGEWWVDLNQCSAGWIQQTVPTVVNRKYRLRFLLGSSGFSGCTPAARLVKVTFGPLVQTIAIQEGEGITAHEFIVSAISTQSLLRFEGLTGGCASGELDEVSVEPVFCGDVDSSGFSDAIDLAIVLANWGPPSPKYPESDINGDGLVNAIDLAIVLSTWGACP